MSLTQTQDQQILQYPSNTSKSTVLVTGASGLLGRAVFKHLKNKGVHVLGTAFSRTSETLKKLDIKDPVATENFLKLTLPSSIIHCAAERRPDQVAKAPQAAAKLNVEGTRHLASLCAAQGIYLIYISTDYVFDGKKSSEYDPTDPPCPMNVYGRLKWEGEQAVQQASTAFAILRVPVLYGECAQPDESAINTLLHVVIQSQTQTMAVDDVQVRYPTNVQEVANVLEKMLLVRPKGVFHYSGNEAWTKFKICEFFADHLNLKDHHLVRNTVVDPTRPTNVKLSCQKLIDEGIQVTPIFFKAWWQEYLRSFEMSHVHN